MLFIADDPEIYPVILPAPGIHRTGEPEGDGSVFGVLEGVVDLRIAYYYSLDFYDQFSYINYFHLSNGLKVINFQSFIQI